MRSLVRLGGATLLCLLAFIAYSPSQAEASLVTAPVLIVDGGGGDAKHWLEVWLGTDASEMGRSDGAVLQGASAPAWVTVGSPPPTYLLSTTSGSSPRALRVEDLTWALDWIQSKHPGSRSVVVAQGAAVLPVRMYLQGLSGEAYRDRADVAGLVMLGAPNNGVELTGRLGEIPLLDEVASFVGLKRQDLEPDSDFVTRLNDAPLPPTIHVLAVNGIVAEFAGVRCDGLVTPADSRLETVAGAASADYQTTVARSYSALPMGDAWRAFATTAKSENVSRAEIDALAASLGYPLDVGTADAFRTFYQTWFRDGARSTHVSTVILLDASGSMEGRFSGTTKFAAAKRAASGFLESLHARTGLEGAVPEDVSLLAFTDSVVGIWDPATDEATARRRLSGLRAKGKTDIGKAIDKAVAEAASAPAGADKVIILLSDGVRTAGLGRKGLIDGPVAKAARLGIRIDTIGLPGVPAEDQEFLKLVAKRTGGSFRSAEDALSLQASFTRARFAGSGIELADERIRLTPSSVVDLGTTSERTTQVEAAVLSSDRRVDVTLLHDGEEVDESLVDLVDAGQGAVLIRLRNPQPGDYKLQLGGKGDVHVFAVRQDNAFWQSAAPLADDPMPTIMLGGVALAAALCIAFVIGAAIRARRVREQASQVELEIVDNVGEA